MRTIHPPNVMIGSQLLQEHFPFLTPKPKFKILGMALCGKHRVHLNSLEWGKEQAKLGEPGTEGQLSTQSFK